MRTGYDLLIAGITFFWAIFLGACGGGPSSPPPPIAPTITRRGRAGRGDDEPDQRRGLQGLDHLRSLTSTDCDD